MSNVITELALARKAAGLSHGALAERARLTRKTVQRAEAGEIDPKFFSVVAMARALGMELMLVPSALRPDLEEFVRSGGRYLGQPVGAGAPKSIVDSITEKK
jgi:ribosome-binding protein aMBF1 (putative translation factor)